MDCSSVPIVDHRRDATGRYDAGEIAVRELFVGVYGVWRERAASDPMPRKSGFEPEAIAPWLRHVVLTRVVDGGADFEALVIGDHVDERLGRPMLRRSMRALHGPASRSRMIQAYETVTADQVPTIFLFDYAGAVAPIAWTEELFLPLADGDGAISHILVAVHFARDVAVPYHDTRWHASPD